MSGRRSYHRHPSGEVSQSYGMSDRTRLVSNERDNDERLNDLHSQVSTLKNITIEIGNEVRDQNKFLDRMGLDFEQTGSLMSGTIKKLTDLAKTERGRNYLLYAALFFVLIFFLFFIRAIF